jgi:hypothetical protein
MWLLRLCDRFFLGRVAGYSPPVLEHGSLAQHTGAHGLWLIRW